jgi:hypothetical protein
VSIETLKGFLDPQRHLRRQWLAVDQIGQRGPARTISTARATDR